MRIRDRIREIRTVKASEILPNPKNWRTHPEEQRDAMQGAFAEIGNIDVLRVVERSEGLMLIDGHLRTDLLGDNEVQVAVLDLTPEEADKALLTFDPLSALAARDDAMLKDLMDDAQFQSDALAEMLENLELSFDVEESELPHMADGDREPIQQMTFVLSDDQADQVKQALAHARAEGPFIETGNENSNGNALARIIEHYLSSAGG